MQMYCLDKKTKSENLSIFKKSWCIAEIKVSYKPKTTTNCIIGNSKDAYSCLLKIWDKSLLSLQEQFNVLFLSNRNEVIGFRNIGTGSATGVVIDNTLILTLSLLCRAKNVIIAHNHTSGSLNPSKNDIDVTIRFRDSLKLLDIIPLDHLIVTKNGYYSFADENNCI